MDLFCFILFILQDYPENGNMTYHFFQKSKPSSFLIHLEKVRYRFMKDVKAKIEKHFTKKKQENLITFYKCLSIEENNHHFDDNCIKFYFSIY